jgi:hypothetical protein
MGGLFKRINFFKGLFMEADDWQKEQRYHREKQRFHNKYLHRPGVISDCLDGLKVLVADSHTALIIQPGYAIDGDGHDLYVPEAKKLEIPPLESFEPPTTIYVSLAYLEMGQEMRTNDANPAYSDYAYIAEDTVIAIDRDEPDNYNKIELARISLSKKPEYISNPTAKELAAEDEIDMSHVPQAGARTATIQKELGLLNFADRLMDATVQVRSGSKKQDDTNMLIERTSLHTLPPMYMVSAHSLDGARIQWWIQCHTNDNSTDYTLHIKNESSKTTSVLCRIFKIRV